MEARGERRPSLELPSTPPFPAGGPPTHPRPSAATWSEGADASPAKRSIAARAGQVGGRSSCGKRSPQDRADGQDRRDGGRRSRSAPAPAQGAVERSVSMVRAARPGIGRNAGRCCQLVSQLADDPLLQAWPGRAGVPRASARPFSASAGGIGTGERQRSCGPSPRKASLARNARAVLQGPSRLVVEAGRKSQAETEHERRQGTDRAGRGEPAASAAPRNPAAMPRFQRMQKRQTRLGLGVASRG